MSKFWWETFRGFVGLERVSKLDIHQVIAGSLTRLDMIDWKDRDGS